jgi:import receptor subunit TOM20
MMNPKTVGIVAGLSAAAFVGYCLYFDRKRRSAPDFKAKLRERRRMAAKKASSSRGPALPGSFTHINYNGKC